MTSTRQTTGRGGRGRGSGAAAPPVASRIPRRTQRAIMASALAVASAAGGVVIAETAQAAPPAFPNNLVVFPDRDFVTVEGFESYAGGVATLTVTRPDVGVIGSAKGTISGGEVAFEVNHPGGYCWGNDTSIKVTPDIRPNDVVAIELPDGQTFDTVVSGAAVDAQPTLNDTTMTVTGHVWDSPLFNEAQTEQRIVNPDLVDLVGKRDVRAVPGGVTPAPKGGYTSNLEFDGNGHFTATYVFDTAEAATAAANSDLGERFMNWQAEDLDANRQGLTIAEFGEAGGPGMGGCPLGPGDVTPAAGQASASQKGTDLTVNWTPAANPNGTTAISNYVVTATDDATGAIIGQKVAATATQAKLVVSATSTYTVEVRSLAGVKLGDPFTMLTGGSGGTGGGTGDTTAPTLTVPDAGQTNSVTLSTNEGSIFYTVGAGVDVLADGDMPSDAAVLYTKPIVITEATTLNMVAIDAVGNHSPVEVREYSPIVQTAPLAAPGNVKATAGQASATVTWDAVPDATTYQVGVYTIAADGTATKAATQPAATAARTQTVTGLTVGTRYGFTVTAQAANRTGTESDVKQTAAQATPTRVTDTVTIATAKWKANDFRVTGSGSVNGNTVTVWRVNADGTKGSQIGTLSVGVALNAYDWRLRTGVPATNPGRIFVESNGGGLAGPFTVSNG